LGFEQSKDNTKKEEKLKTRKLQQKEAPILKTYHANFKYRLKKDFPQN
jgi:hypothetical protein